MYGGLSWSLFGSGLLLDFFRRCGAARYAGFRRRAERHLIVFYRIFLSSIFAENSEGVSPIGRALVGDGSGLCCLFADSGEGPKHLFVVLFSRGVVKECAFFLFFS